MPNGTETLERYGHGQAMIIGGVRELFSDLGGHFILRCGIMGSILTYKSLRVNTSTIAPLRSSPSPSVDPLPFEGERWNIQT